MRSQMVKQCWARPLGPISIVNENIIFKCKNDTSTKFKVIWIWWRIVWDFHQLPESLEVPLCWAGPISIWAPSNGIDFPLDAAHARSPGEKRFQEAVPPCSTMFTSGKVPPKDAKGNWVYHSLSLLIPHRWLEAKLGLTDMSCHLPHLHSMPS